MFLLRPSFLVLTVLMTAVLQSGCIPSSHVDASPVTGQVLDRTTRRPVANAKVVLGATNPDRMAQTLTDQEGRFHLAGFRHLVFTPLPYSMFISPGGYLEVEAAGYKPFRDAEWVSPDSDGYFNWHEAHGVGSEQHVHILLAPVGSTYPSSDGNEKR